VTLSDRELTSSYNSILIFKRTGAGYRFRTAKQGGGGGCSNNKNKNGKCSPLGQHIMVKNVSRRCNPQQIF
jgi:hypothetical protein